MTTTKPPQGGVGGIAALPEWPEKPHDAYGTTIDWLNYHALVTYVVLARMEALVEYAQHDDSCMKWSGDTEGGRWLLDYSHCTCGLSELLASCERGSAAQPSGAGWKESEQ